MRQRNTASHKGLQENTFIQLLVDCSKAPAHNTCAALHLVL